MSFLFVVLLILQRFQLNITLFGLILSKAFSLRTFKCYHEITMEYVIDYA